MSRAIHAKYPFTEAAAEYAGKFNLTLEEIVKPEYEAAVARAEERVTQAIFEARSPQRMNNLNELLSFPIANMFVMGIGEDYLGKRYALSESVRAYNLLRKEKLDFILELARKEFGWNIETSDRVVGELKSDFKIHFTNYLNNVADIRSSEWKLINRLLIGGFVEIQSTDAIRLLQEEIRRRIENLVSNRSKIELPPSLQVRVNILQKIYLKYRSSQLPQSTLPAEVNFKALPPCIRDVYESLKIGAKAGHVQRFAITSFFLNIGMVSDAVAAFFQSLSDFNPDFTRYQVRHIAGESSSKTKYTAPACKWMKTHGICVGECVGVRHPLTYYRRHISEEAVKK
jgi:DNA primase large subunit